MTPMGAIVHGMGGAMEAQTVGMAASQMAQQQAMSQLAGFNGQIKSKDDVTVQYQLVATGQTSPVLQNTLQGKAKSDGEEVLTPLLQQAATAVLGHVGKKLKATLGTQRHGFHSESCPLLTWGVSSVCTSPSPGIERILPTSRTAAGKNFMVCASSAIPSSRRANESSGRCSSTTSWLL